MFAHTRTTVNRAVPPLSRLRWRGVYVSAPWVYTSREMASGCRTTRRLLPRLSTFGALVCFAVPLLGSQAKPFKNGQAFYVIAERADMETSRFYVCKPGAPLSPQFPGLELTRDGRERRGQPDPEIKSRIQAAFAKQKRYRVAATLEEADYVFLAEATFGTIVSADLHRTADEEAARTRFLYDHLGERPVPDEYGRLGVDDAAPNTMVSIVAMAVPAEAYRRIAGDSVALLKARVWEGAHIGVNFEDASPEDLVAQLLGQPERPDQGPRALFDFERDPAFLRERLHREHPEMYRLNGRSICSEPQPGRAPMMIAEDQAAGAGAAVAQAKSAANTGDQRPATFQSRVLAVAVPTVVTTAEGAFVGGLTAADFRLYEDDVEQRIDRVMSKSERFTAALLVDVSGSMWPQRSEEKVAASAFIDALRPEDRALVVAFDSRTWLMADVTSDKSTLRSAIVHLSRHGFLTKLYDALDVVTTERLDKIGGRKAVVVLTDGMDTGSQAATAPTAMARLESAGVPVYPVQFNSLAAAPRRQPGVGQMRIMPEGYFDTVTSFEHAGEYLGRLARDTGGLFSAATSVETVVGAFRRVADDLRSQYVLYYYPLNQSQDGAFRHIHVAVNRPGMTVRARAGYRAGPSAP